MMETKIIVLALVTFFHDLFTAIWIGGLIAIGITALPSARIVLGKSPETKRLMDGIQKRQSWLVYVSIAGLLITGLLLARRTPAFEGLFAFGNAYSAILAMKHIFVVGMIAIALYRSLVLGRSKKPLTPSQENLSGRLLFLNIGLGTLVLLLSGLITALSSVPL